jgi:nucleoside-diphosphate-sugar epimerase
MRVLVMGGTQFNGLALVRELARTGHDVTVLNRGQTAADLHRSVRRLQGDRTDVARMRELFAHEEFDCVQDMSAYHPEDVELMVELFHGKTGHYVFASSTVIYAASDVLPISEDHPVDRSDAQVEYGLHKLLCEDILVRAHRERGFPATIVPFSMVFGPHNTLLDREQRMFARLRSGRPILIPGDGTALSQVGHVDDQARALRLLMGQPVTFGKRYNLTGAQAYSDEGYVDTFAAVVGVEANKVFIPAPVMDAAWDGELELGLPAPQVRMDIRTSDIARRASAAGRARWQLASLVQKLAPNLHRWNRSVVFDISRLRRDIGWGPSTRSRRWSAHLRVVVPDGPRCHQTFDFGFEDELLARSGVESIAHAHRHDVARRGHRLAQLAPQRADVLGDGGVVDGPAGHTASSSCPRGSAPRCTRGTRAVRSRAGQRHGDAVGASS